MTAFVDPTREQFGAFAKMPDEGEIWMLNMLRFREHAAYENDHPKAQENWTGRQAYTAYGEASGPIFRRVGGRILWRAEPKVTVIGPTDEAWDMVFVAVYPNAAAFIEMVKDAEYQVAVKHRQAAVATSRLVRMAPEENGEGFGL